MHYIKSLLVGLAIAFGAVAIYALAIFGYFMAAPYLARMTGGGSGGIGMVVESGPLFVVALLAFVLGAWWRFRRG